MLDSCFHSKIEEVDFTNKIEDIVQDINSWYAKHTNHKIKEILTAGTKFFILLDIDSHY